ncbi:MAG: hypothetical protein JWO32_1461 [Bacteroidetes bacterium]|nr:hypothetical protein [Bacteroidota bacterium]
MKKSILTLSLVALFSIASNAQETKTKTTTKAQEPVKASTVNDDGTSKIEKKEETPVKKAGTRMAINEKGMPGVKAKNNTKHEEKKTESTTPQPGSPANKKDE